MKLGTEKPKLILSDYINGLVAKEDLPQQKISVPERLPKLPPLLSQAKAELTQQTYLNQGLTNTYKSGIHLRVSKENVERSIKILAVLISAFEKRGFPFSIKEQRHGDYQFPTVTIDDCKVEFRLQERLKKTKIDSLEQISDKTLRKQISYGFKAGEPVLIPSGQLYVQIETYTSISCKKLWSDSEKLPLEKQLNGIMKGLIVASAAIKQFEAEREDRNKKWDLERRAAEVKETKRQEKIERRKALATLANQITEHDKIITLKALLQERLDQAKLTPEEKHLVMWIDEYLSEPDPLSKFILEKVKPTIEMNQQSE